MRAWLRACVRACERVCVCMWVYMYTRTHINIFQYEFFFILLQLFYSNRFSWFWFGFSDITHIAISSTCSRKRDNLVCKCFWSIPSHCSVNITINCIIRIYMNFSAMYEFPYVQRCVYG